jgi:hypothetical protein
MLPIPQTASTSTSSTCHPPPVPIGLYGGVAPSVKRIIAFWKKFSKVDFPWYCGEIQTVK